MIKEIRILSGRHRGAALRLAPGTWRIGADDAAGVHISDWLHAPVTLTIAEDGRMCWSGGDATADTPVAIVEHQTLQFNDISLSIGDPDHVVDTPRCVAASVVSDAPAPAARGGLTRWLALGAVAVPAAMLSTALLAMQPVHVSPAAPQLDSLRRQMPGLLAGIGQTGLQVNEQNGLIVVRGVVRSGADASAVRDLLRRTAPDHAVAHLAIVNDVLASITESLREPTLNASYAGDGRFVVTGTTRDSAVVRKHLAQLAADLGPAVRLLESRVTEVRPGWSVADSDSALDTGGLRYVQSLDGSKHFPTPALSADADPAALAVAH